MNIHNSRFVRAPLPHRIDARVFAMPLGLLALPLAFVLHGIRPRHECGICTVAARHAPARADAAAPTLREQMMAYLKSVQERGIELTPDQKAMIREFQEDEELLEQTGRVDFMKGAQVLTPDEFTARQQTAPLPSVMSAPVSMSAIPAPTPMAASAAIGGFDGWASTVGQTYSMPPPDAVDATKARLWLMQRSERETAIRLLAQSALRNGLTDVDSRELRRVLASLIVTLTS